MRIVRLILPLLLLWTTSSIAATKVLVVLGRADAPYENLVQAIRNQLASMRADIELNVKQLDQLDTHAIRAPQAALVVTVGAEAARQLARANPPVPILHGLLPRAAAQEVLRQGRTGKPAPRDSAIYLDQPIARQFDLLRIALPRHKRVGVILGPSTHSQLGELRAAARERALKLRVATIHKSEELLSSLEDVLEDTEVLVTVPDPLIYHSGTIHHLLLTTYRYRVPVMGLSKAYVDAGALMAVHSTPENIGRQIAEILMSLPGKGEIVLPPPQYPRYFSVSVNRRVAASLDLALGDEAALLRKLEAIQRP